MVFESSRYDIEQTSRMEMVYEVAFWKILRSIPHLLVSYEPKEFSAIINNEKRGTKPDFHIINTKRSAVSNTKGKYVELTFSPDRDTGNRRYPDPKARQRAILRKNGVNHVILFQSFLLQLQKNHKDLDFGFEKTENGWVAKKNQKPKRAKGLSKKKKRRKQGHSK